MRIGRLLRFRRRRNPEFWLGNQARDLRRWREAAGHYEKALALQPERAAIWVQYGHALKEAGDSAAGERAYREAIARAPEIADTHLQLGHVLKLQGRSDEAATAYLAALDRDPQLHPALFELSNLGWAVGEARDAVARRIAASLRGRNSAYRDRTLSGASDRAVVIDVSDLVDYFQNNRIPTGIQRVQINVATSLLRAGGSGPAPAVASLRAGGSGPAPAVASLRWNGEGWTILPEDLFLRLADLALAGGERDEPVWRAALSELFLVLAFGEPLAFPAGAILVTMGGAPSSWLRNYFLILQSAKARYGVRYVPFVHDCIPLLGAQHCSAELTGDFIGWLIGAFLHADGFLVNSRATARDLASAARLLGRPEPRPAVVPLGACSSSLIGGDPGRGGDTRILARYGLKRRDFVVFVSTIESRKNHPHAFDAWLTLIRKRGARRTPMLVCVGKPGWRAEPAMARLAASRGLRRKVLILSKVPDGDLAVLYRRCLFTLYPSSYEGWGLPVTESLCHGKVPLIARASSLPEAGGDLAEYCDLDQPGDLCAKLERLIADRAYREAREARIGREFAARSWRDIALEIVAGALAQTPAANAGKAAAPLPAETGRYYALARNRETRVWPGMTCGEMYRVGHGWSPPDERGCRLRREEAEIAFSLAGLAAGASVYLGLCAAAAADYRVRIAGAAAGEEGTLAAGEERWIVLDLAPDLLRAGAVRITLATSGHFRPDAEPDGNPRRVALGVLGFYLCRQHDALARRRFLDALQARRLDRLGGWQADTPAAACSSV